MIQLSRVSEKIRDSSDWCKIHRRRRRLNDGREQMAMGNVVQKISEGRNIRKAWRDEKVFIYFSPRGTDEFAGHSVPGDWIVAEPRKPVSPGQEVTWQAVG